MKIPLMNPNRPPKQWWDRKIIELKKSGYRSPQSLAGHIWFHVMSPEARLHVSESIEKRPATCRGTSQSTKESRMVRTRKSPRRKTTRRAKVTIRVNPRKRVKARRNPKFASVHRPAIMWTPKGWARRKHKKSGRPYSRLTGFNKKGIVRINPRKRRSYRNNPMKLPFGIDKVAVSAAKIAGGLVIGYLMIPVISKVMPATITEKYGKFYGAFNVLIGAVAAATMKNKAIKDAALIVAGVGIYDLIASNLPMLGLAPVLRSNTMLHINGEPGVIGSSYQEVGADYAPAMGSSYQEVGDDICYGGDEIEIG